MAYALISLFLEMGVKTMPANLTSSIFYNYFRSYLFRAIAVWTLIGLTACGGGGSSSPNPSPDPTPTNNLTTLTGAFVDPEPIEHAEITVIDSSGNTRTSNTDKHGFYYTDVSGMDQPSLVIATYEFNGVVHTEYSLITEESRLNTQAAANINEFTTLLVMMMAEQAGISLDTAFESLDAAALSNLLSQDPAPLVENINTVFCSLILTEDQSGVAGCNWKEGESVLSLPYVPNAELTMVDLLVYLVGVDVDTTTGEVTVSDSSGQPVLTLPISDLVGGNVSEETIPPDDSNNINNRFIPPTERNSKKNGKPIPGQSGDGMVIGVEDYVSVFPHTEVTVDNLTACDIEIVNLQFTAGFENAPAEWPWPYIGYPEPTSPLSIDTSPEIEMNMSAATVTPVDACKPYAFNYKFYYAFKIRKLKTGADTWEYELPGCEAFGNPDLEEVLQDNYRPATYIDSLFTQPYIEYNPPLMIFHGTWDQSEADMVYDATCPMVAEFSLSSSEGLGPLTIDVNGDGSVGSDIVSYSWMTSDGQSATGETAQFTFSSGGIFDITLTVENSFGVTESVTKTVTVHDLPVADFTWAKSTTQSLGVVLDASASTGANITYQWSTSDGQTAFDQTANFVFGSAGTYTVTLTVTDKFGNSESVSGSISVEVLAFIAGCYHQTSTQYSMFTDFCVDGSGSVIGTHLQGTLTYESASSPTFWVDTIDQGCLTEAREYTKDGYGNWFFAELFTLISGDCVPGGDPSQRYFDNTYYWEWYMSDGSIFISGNTDMGVKNDGGYLHFDDYCSETQLLYGNKVCTYMDGVTEIPIPDVISGL